VPGINNDSLVYGVLDLIKNELRRHDNNSTQTWSDPFQDTPSVLLHRLHPADDEVLTNASLYFPSGYQVEISLELGMSTDEIQSALEKNRYPALPTGSIPGDVLDYYSQLPLEQQMNTDEKAGTGTDDHDHADLSAVLPEEVKDASHPDYDFFTKWRLNRVRIETLNQEGNLIDSFNIRLLYDYRSFLTGTLIERI
jgi:hypothetical protein